MKLGLTGSFGSGKSSVADMLRLTGDAFIIDADSITRDLQQPGEVAFKAIVEEFGSDIVREDGELDRLGLASIVFHDRNKLQKLNDIVHPLVWKEIGEQLKLNHNLTVLMVPLFFESGSENLVDKTLVVTLSEEKRKTRLMERDGLSQQQINDRLAYQMPQNEKEKRADFVIDNNGTPDETLEQTRGILNKLGIAVNQAG